MDGEALSISGTCATILAYVLRKCNRYFFYIDGGCLHRVQIRGFWENFEGPIRIVTLLLWYTVTMENSPIPTISQHFPTLSARAIPALYIDAGQKSCLSLHGVFTANIHNSNIRYA